MLQEVLCSETGRHTQQGDCSHAALPGSMPGLPPCTGHPASPEGVSDDPCSQPGCPGPGGRALNLWQMAVGSLAWDQGPRRQPGTTGHAAWLSRLSWSQSSPSDGAEKISRRWERSILVHSCPEVGAGGRITRPASCPGSRLTCQDPPGPGSVSAGPRAPWNSSHQLPKIPGPRKQKWAGRPPEDSSPKRVLWSSLASRRGFAGRLGQTPVTSTALTLCC